MVAVHGNVVMAVCVDAVSTRSLEQLLDVIREATRKFPEGVGVAIVLPRGAPVLTAKRDRELASKMIGQPGVTCLTLVLEGDGFWAATARSILVGLSTLAQRRTPVKVLASIDAAASWFAETLRGPALAPGLHAALRASRERATPRFR